MNIIDCSKKGFIKKISPDKDLVNSLIISAENRMKTQDFIILNEVTSSSKVSLAYDSLREFLEALAVSKGFKIYNHECYTSFLKYELRESVLAESFDDMRKLRNSINYYGKSVTIEEAKSIINAIKELISKIRKLG